MHFGIFYKGKHRSWAAFLKCPFSRGVFWGERGGNGGGACLWPWRTWSCTRDLSRKINVLRFISDNKTIFCSYECDFLFISYYFISNNLCKLAILYLHSTKFVWHYSFFSMNLNIHIIDLPPKKFNSKLLIKNSCT